MRVTASKRLDSIAPYAFKEINDKVDALKKAFKAGEAKAPIDFGVGDPSEPTPDFVIEGLVAAGEKHATTGYPSYTGSLELREAAAAYMMRRFGVKLDPETEFCSSLGSKEAVFNFAEAFVNPGEVVISPSPGYPPMKTGAIFAEAELHFAPLLEEKNWLLDYAAIPEDVAARAKIIWINYPNSPTGAAATEEYYRGLIAWARKNEIIIAADEGCYIDIYYDEEAPVSILEVAQKLADEGKGEKDRPYAGIAAFYSLSKRNNMTGYRVGFVCGDEEVISIYKRLKTNIDSGTANVMQEAGILALNDDDHVAEMRALYSKKREILYGAFRDIGLEVRESDATFFVWQKAPEGMSDVEFAKKLLEPDVALVVTPGSLISEKCIDAEGQEFNPGHGYVRFALMPTMEEMEEAAERLKEAF